MRRIVSLLIIGAALWLASENPAVAQWGYNPYAGAYYYPGYVTPNYTYRYNYGPFGYNYAYRYSYPSYSHPSYSVYAYPRFSYYYNYPMYGYRYW
jgi:hypothetical protein